MRRMWVLVAVIVAGCRAAPTGEAFRPEVADPARAVIYIYHAGGRPVSVFIDQRPEGRLSRGEYLVRMVDPGDHFIRVEGGSMAVRRAVLVAGDAVYMEVSTSRLTGRAILEMPDTDLARRRIARARKVEEPAGPLDRSTLP
jgi:hypothetical protein